MKAKRLLSIVLSLSLAMMSVPVTAMAVDTTLGDTGETNISLTAEVPGLSSLTVTVPTKTTYNVGDELDTSGMVVTANYSDNSTKDVTSDVTLSGFDSASKGDVTVTVSYTEKDITKTGTFDVTIVDSSVDTYTIAVSASPSEGGTVSGGGEVEKNTSVTVTATANSAYSFVKWTENGEQVSTDASYTFTATGNRTLVAVFEPEQVIYTVTVQPGEGTGSVFTVDSATVISREEMMSGSYDQTKGCFYLDAGTVYYRFPTQCPFTAPEGQEFDCWQLSSGGTFSGGTMLPAETYGSYTITALYKDKEPESSVTLSIPATINITYGDTQTAFDVQVKAATFNQGYNEVDVNLFDSSFTCASNGGTIPFTVTTNGNNASIQLSGGTHCCFEVYSDTSLPYTCQGFINITNDAWAAAQPGSYTATLKVMVLWW